MEDGRGGNAFNPDIAAPCVLQEASKRMSAVRSHHGDDPKRRRSQVPAVGKALEILELLSATRDGLSHSAIAAELGWSINETYRTVELLEARGWLLRSADTDRFSVSLKLFQLGHRHPPTRLLIDRAIPIMNAVAALTIPFMAQWRQRTDVPGASARLALAARTLAVAIGSLGIAAE